jgi:hypothetical protein
MQKLQSYLAACVLQYILLRVFSLLRGEQGTAEKGHKQNHGMNVIEKNKKTIQETEQKWR